MVNSNPDNKILDKIQLNAFADDKIIVAQMKISVFDRVENIVGKGENAGYQHFLLFQQCFQKASFLGKEGLCGNDLTCKKMLICQKKTCGLSACMLLYIPGS